jgi:hypothetical protein
MLRATPRTNAKKSIIFSREGRQAIDALIIRSCTISPPWDILVLSNSTESPCTVRWRRHPSRLHRLAVTKSEFLSCAACRKSSWWDLRLPWVNREGRGCRGGTAAHDRARGQIATSVAKMLLAACMLTFSSRGTRRIHTEVQDPRLRLPNSSGVCALTRACTNESKQVSQRRTKNTLFSGQTQSGSSA